ncbi:myelin regulatory factor-like protein isoform X2 [Diabrotica virgifera virgifera]|uniref:Myelin regulatory factor n=1 Tax=Diabrotica virgifera virgifera TaxID=50390 RepID=A0ABM5K0X8_DIAVI|nr:myelin regulatory factor-like protein isoform X2 [Diabrotica virgifera virgifera]
MDSFAADLAIQAILARGTDFVGGIDNEALDFSQLEDFINSEGSQGNNTYFGDSLNSTPTSGKLLNVIVENKRNIGHSLPESPPDSSSEHPYSPQDGCEAPITSQESMYTNLTQGLYKPTILSPILTDNIILGSHIVVTDQNSEQLLENGGILQDNGLIVSGDIRNGTTILSNRAIQENLQGDQTILQGRIILSESNVTDTNRPILLASPESAPNFDRSIYKSDDFDKNMVHLGYNHNIENLPRNNIDNNICEQNLDNIQNVYTNLQAAPKKRKLSQDSPLVKSEPDHCTASQLSPSEQLNTSMDEDYASSEACLSESQYQCIRFSAFQQNNWHMLCDQNLTELPVPHYRVDADKGFNFSNADDAFVCQKKNHFQVTCHVQLLGDAQFVKTPDGFQKISSFHLHFYGVKHDCPTQTIRVEQSQSDRSKKPFHPVLVELVNAQVTKVTVGRLHFSETTSNNMRKKGKPNPEQRYFQLVVGLHAHTTNGNFPIVSHASQKIIVRASNPGQFESDVELCWQKGQTQDSVVHNGRVGINTDRPDESLVVHGNIKITGHIIQPSDIRAKKNIVECNTAEQLKNVQRLRVVRYEYEPALANQLSRDNECSDTGVIAQEVAQVLPEAVKPAGNIILPNGTSIENFLVVNKERIFMENIGAVKELCKVTDNLETRIDQLERINRRLNKLKRGDSLKSTSTVNSSKLSYSHKCSKHHHSCHKEDELCSNKFIQIVIVILVLIMAFCLAAITTLYLMETTRPTQYIQPNIERSHKNYPTKRPAKITKAPTWTPTLPPYYPTSAYKEEEITKITLDPNLLSIKPSYIIGRPQDCIAVDQDLENTNLCQIFCCANPPPRHSQEIPSTHYSSEKRLTNAARNKTGPLINLEKNKISKPFHSNDIDNKQIRQKRDSYSDDTNFFDITDDPMFTIILHGRNFNTTLTTKYKVETNSPYNISYSVPISKYMPDEFINLIFRSSQTNLKEIEHCYNDFKQHECPFVSSQAYYDDKMKIRHKVNENSASQLIGYQSIVFEVDMIDYQSKIMTYRASLKPNLNNCRLPASKLGLDYVEYNFHFYRHCDE